ncbi:beta family protein [Chelativorans intermedius]|uniref:Beta family protein n=1 Tax=Chelativorans intermedius TaxID=515947 RepID=A0ABV6DDC3_9HYPH|nr:beta family protein [Chelativorans intermedius]MCT9000640.1 beta family protein [Chelativorans intermedius]
MILTEDMYVPALRWRQGEYQALARLAAVAKDRIVPYVTIPEVEFDFELWQPKKTVQEHVHPFAARFKAKWGQRPAWVGVHPSISGEPMGDGRDIFTYVFEAMRTFQANAMPAVPLDASSPMIASVAGIVATDGLGAAIAVRLEDLMKPDARTRIEALAAALGVSLHEIDLIVDLGAPNFEPYNAFAGALIAAMQKLGDLHAFRNFVVIGTAIPETFKDIAKGADQLPRHDWLFYQALLGKMPVGVRQPNYGDYTIVHPEFKALDMRMIKAAGKLVYTTSAAWEVRKGGAFNDNRAQMHGHCASIVASGKFDGAGYSSGDEYIARCAVHKEGPSNQTRWKEVAINHHITRVLDDLATLGAAP